MCMARYIEKRLQGRVPRERGTSCEQLQGGSEVSPPREPAETAHDTSDGVHRTVYHTAADLYDLYGIYQLQQDRRAPGTLRLGRT